MLKLMMKKKNLFLKIFLPVICSFSVLFSISPCFSAFADTVDGQQVLDDTRYSAVGFGTVGDIIGIISAIADESMQPTIAEQARDSIMEFGKKVAEKFVQDTIDSANKTWHTAPNYTIQATFCIMGKRKIIYPNGENEVQTVICYINKNVDDAFPQQFGQYTIAPNTIFFVRQTSWAGVIPISIPIAENNIQYFTYNADYAFELWVNVPPDNTFVYDTPDGRQTFGLRHSGAKIHFINNTVNSIVRSDFLDVSPSYYSTFFPNTYADNVPAFIGNGYNYESATGYMLSDCMPFYVTTAFFNSDWEFGDKTYNYYNTDPDNIDPSKPPAYIIPNDNPLFHGQTINNNTINNYNDYGITEIDGQLSIDPDVLAGALGALVDPDFQGALAGVFDLQPQIGLGFDTPLDLNLPDLVGDFIDSIIVYPDTPFDWSEPTFPVITQATAPSVLPDYNLPIVTFPSSAVDTAGQIFDIATDLWQPSGILNLFLIIALIGLSVYLIF